MKHTQHFKKQSHNRGITNTMVEIVNLFGYESGDRIIMDRKHIMEIINEVNLLRKQLIKMYEKGGVVVVKRNSSLITAFAITNRLGKVKEKYKKVG